MKRTNFVLALVALLGCACFVAWADGLAVEVAEPSAVEVEPKAVGPVLADAMTPDERQAACVAAVEAALRKYHCRINAIVIVSAAGNFPRVEIVPIQKEEP